MRKSAIVSVTLFLLFVFLISGCSGGAKNNPVVPDDSSLPKEPELSVNIPDNLPDGATVPMIFGFYELELDPSKLSGQIRPLRTSAALGDNFHVDLTPFLTISPCSNCIDIKSIALNGSNNIEMTIRTKHPFDTSRRYDLHVFDMRGILVTGDNIREYSRVKADLDGDGSRESPIRGNVTLLVNPDGYTTFYDAIVESHIGRFFDGNLCPYKNLWFNPATDGPKCNYNPSAQPEYGFADLTHPMGHNVFPMGSTFDDPKSQTTYEFNLSGLDSFTFMLVLEASYGQSTRRVNRKEPRYFLPEFHRKDAWRVTAGLTANDLKGKVPSSSAVLQVSVCDWQAGITPTETWDFHTSGLAEIRYRSDVKEVYVDIPEILQNGISRLLLEKISGNGTFPLPYTWVIPITNEKAVDAGTYYGLVAVRDDLEGSPNAPLAVSGSEVIPKKLGDVTTYQAFEVYVQQTNQPPVADVQVAPDPVRACKDVTISVGPGAMDPDGQIVKYEYDIDYSGNPSSFTADYYQDQGSPTFGQPIVMQFDQTRTGNHLIGQRVTDNLGSAAIDVTNLQVNPNQAPTAVLQDSDADDIVTHNDTVTFQPGVGTGDSDGVIVRYEYDFAYNGTTFVPDVIQNQGQPNFGQPVQYTFLNTGASDIQVKVAFRVADDGCPELTGMTVTTFTVHPILTGLPILEDFETTNQTNLPNNWGITGRSGGAYYLDTGGGGCINTTWKWGVTVNTAQGNDSGSNGQTHFLNENGYVNGGSDPNITYMNRACIVYTPEFTCPATGATLTIRHWYNMTYVNFMGFNALDGGLPIITGQNPGTIDWSDFCYSSTYNNTPKYPLTVASGPVYHSVATTTCGNHPLYGFPCHTFGLGDTTPSWRTNTYDIPLSYAGQKLRVGFLFASDDIAMGIDTDCDPTPFATYGITLGPGWRIQWMKIEAN